MPFDRKYTFRCGTNLISFGPRFTIHLYRSGIDFFDYVTTVIWAEKCASKRLHRSLRGTYLNGFGIGRRELTLRVHYPVLLLPFGTRHLESVLRDSSTCSCLLIDFPNYFPRRIISKHDFPVILSRLYLSYRIFVIST